jgi:uncharacterized membrane protein
MNMTKIRKSAIYMSLSSVNLIIVASLIILNLAIVALLFFGLSFVWLFLAKRAMIKESQSIDN